MRPTRAAPDRRSSGVDRESIHRAGRRVVAGGWRRRAVVCAEGEPLAGGPWWPLVGRTGATLVSFLTDGRSGLRSLGRAGTARSAARCSPRYPGNRSPAARAAAPRRWRWTSGARRAGAERTCTWPRATSNPARLDVGNLTEQDLPTVDLVPPQLRPDRAQPRVARWAAPWLFVPEPTVRTAWATTSPRLPPKGSPGERGLFAAGPTARPTPGPPSSRSTPRATKLPRGRDQGARAAAGQRHAAAASSR